MSNNVVTINGASYTRNGLEALPRDPDLRNLARWVQENERREVSRSWIGSMASKSDLVEFLLGTTPPAAIGKMGEGNQGDQKIKDYVSPSPDGQNGNPSPEVIAQILKLLGQLGGAGGIKQEALDAMEARLRAEFEELLAKGPRPLRIEIKEKGGEIKPIGTQHMMFPVVAEFVEERKHVALVGPAGSGKTRMAHELAKHLGLPFEALSVCSQTTMSNIMGYMNADGQYVSTAFRRRVEEGGILLLDEFDAGNANVGNCINAATANDHCGFPDGLVNVHKDFVCVLGMNTYGNGADRIYVGRNQLDGATTSRFAFLDLDYDHGLELDIAPNREWTLWVQKVRGAVATLKIRHIVSPRASINGGAMLNRGVKREIVEKAFIWQGLAETEVNKIKAALK